MRAKSDSVFLLTLVDLLVQVIFFGIFLGAIYIANEAKVNPEIKRISDSNAKVIVEVGVLKVAELVDAMVRLVPIDRIMELVVLLPEFKSIESLKAALRLAKAANFDPKIIEDTLRKLTTDLMRVSIHELLDAIIPQIYDRIPKQEIEVLVMSAARERIEVHYEYAYLASRIALNGLYKSVLGCPFNDKQAATAYRAKFANYIEKGVSYTMLHAGLKEFDLEKIAAAIDPERDKLFMFLGTQILMDRYLLRDRTMDSAIYEMPQWFWMRVAMGLSLKEENKEENGFGTDTY